MTPVTDDELERRIAAAVAAADPGALLALAEAHALALEQLERVAVALVDLNDELRDDDHDPGPLLVRAAWLRYGDAASWIFVRGRASYTLGDHRPSTIQDAIAFGEAWDDGLELRSPVTAQLPWPAALAAELALDYAGNLLHDLSRACDDSTHATLKARLAEIRTARAADDRKRLGQIDQELRRVIQRAEKVAPRCADAADAAQHDAILNQRAYAWEGTRLAALAVHACCCGPHEALGELFELRRLAIYPEHAAEHNLDRWYSRGLADHDDLLNGDELVPDALAIIDQLVRAAIAAYLAPPAA